MNWSETNKIPADMFWWEGLDGSRVLAHTFNNPVGGYNGYLGPEAYLATWRNFRGKATHPATLLAVGYGDGGGGVTPAMVEREAQLRNFPVLPKARWGKVRDFYAAAHERAATEAMPVWQGEIYLELHRATLTTQSGVKKKHRQAERALITAETLAGLAHLIGAAAPESIEPLWRVVLKNEFHDILPGSSIREVYEDAERELGEAIDGGRKAQGEALGRIVAQLPKGGLGKALVVVNPTLSPRPLRARLADGTTVAGEEIVPPLGIAALDRNIVAKAGLSASTRHLENDFLRAEIGADGTVASLVHKPTGREALAGRGNQLWAYPVDKPRNWDAWDVEEDYAVRGEELTTIDSIDLVETGPHRAAGHRRGRVFVPSAPPPRRLNHTLAASPIARRPMRECGDHPNPPRVALGRGRRRFALRRRRCAGTQSESDLPAAGSPVDGDRPRQQRSAARPADQAGRGRAQSPAVRGRPVGRAVAPYGL